MPGDISIDGFNDDDLAAGFGLTTVRQPVSELGTAAAELLVELIGGEAPLDGPLILLVKLVVRSSTAAPRR